MENIMLNQEYKDHTIENPVNSLRQEDLPNNAYTVHNQSIRVMHVTMQILDEKTQRVIETITGKADSGRIRVDSESMMRREAEIRLAIDADLFPKPDSLIWFGKICRIYVGIEDASKNKEVVNFLVGTYWIESVGYSLDANNHVINVSLLDKMMKWVDNKLEYATRIETGVPIHEAMKLLMEHIGETDFGHFDESREGEVVPYTIEYSIGDEVVNLITELRDMYMDYVIGYDVAGNFEFRRVATQQEGDLETPKWRFDAQDENLKTMISYDENYNLRNIRNRIVVYGGTSTVTGITPVGGSRITDSKSPFNIHAIGEKTDIITEDRYVLNEQCTALARFEAFKSSNFQEVASIVTVPIYILDVFDVVDVIHPYTRLESKYIIDEISFGLGVEDTMMVKAHKLYFVSLEYGEEQKPIVDYIINGINGYGWIRLSERLIERAFGIQGSGRATLNISFIDHGLGGFQASTTSYPTTENQSLEFDIADFTDIDFSDPLGGYIEGSSRNQSDSVSRIVAHEMLHIVMNDYLGHDKTVQIPVWAREGFSEGIHGGHRRFESVFLHLSNANKKAEIIKLAEWLLDDNFDGSSEDYVGGYLIFWAIYRIAKRNGLWNDMFYRMKQEENLAFNFLSKVIPVAETTKEIKDIIINELENNMDDIWEYLFKRPTRDTDTGSVLGILGEDIYGIPITDENIINIADYDGLEPSIGFKLKFIR